MQWPIVEKEQFSPVSVLDCPFEDDEEVSSPFQHMEGEISFLILLTHFYVTKKLVSNRLTDQNPIDDTRIWIQVHIQWL